MKFARFALPALHPELNIWWEYYTYIFTYRGVQGRGLYDWTWSNHRLIQKPMGRERLMWTNPWMLEATWDHLSYPLMSPFHFSLLHLQSSLPNRTLFLTTYYLYNENVWLDGYLFDFLQKKTVDSWLRNYVIYTGFLFSERLVFDSVIRVYVDFFVNVARSYTLFESPNISSILNTVVFTYFTLFIILTLSIVAIL